MTETSLGEEFTGKCNFPEMQELQKESTSAQHSVHKQESQVKYKHNSMPANVRFKAIN